MLHFECRFTNLDVQHVLCVSILPPFLPLLLASFEYSCFILVPFFFQVVEPGEVISKTGLSVPHTSHCLGSGDIMISAMGDPQGNAKGMFYIILTLRERRV